MIRISALLALLSIILTACAVEAPPPVEPPVTVTAPPQTVTVTAPAKTVTAPPQTVTTTAPPVTVTLTPAPPPPVTVTRPPVTVTVTPTIVPPGLPDVSVVGVTYRVTEMNATWWRYAWRLTLRNNRTDKSVRLDALIKLLDSDGFIVVDDMEYGIQIPPQVENTFTGSTLVDRGFALSVRNIKAEVKNSRVVEQSTQ